MLVGVVKMLRSEDLIKEYRWPMKGDRLLRDSEDWNRGVDFCQDKGTRHVAIWAGYMNAGAELIKILPEQTK